MVYVMGFNLNDEQYLKLNSLAQKFYNWNSLTYTERQIFIKDKILKEVL